MLQCGWDGMKGKISVENNNVIVAFGINVCIHFQ